MTLSEFLLARIDDDEAATLILECICGEGVSEVDPLPGCPARVLAECAAKRQILGRYVTVTDQIDEVTTGGSAGHPTILTGGGIAVGLELALHELAAVYADHPDYDESWRP